MTDQNDVERNCPECDGTGQDRGMHPVRLGEKNEFRPCTKCGGSGKIKETAAIAVIWPSKFDASAPLPRPLTVRTVD
ncbi:hypothetical protein [Bradyrhizobium manausense]|nr:hypothetical protein [Bradyrhizobium manausense]